MMTNKRAILPDTFAGIIISTILFFVVLGIGKVAFDAYFGGSQAIKSLNDFTVELNSQEFKNGEIRQTFLSLEKGMAVIGFSRNTQDFRCYGCPQGYSENLLYYSINKPTNQECDNKPCVCLCKKDLKIEATIGDGTKVACGNFICRGLNNDIINKISLESNLREKNIQFQNYPYWEKWLLFC